MLYCDRLNATVGVQTAPCGEVAVMTLVTAHRATGSAAGVTHM